MEAYVPIIHFHSFGLNLEFAICERGSVFHPGLVERENDVSVYQMNRLLTENVKFRSGLLAIRVFIVDGSFGTIRRFEGHGGIPPHGGNAGDFYGAWDSRHIRRSACE